METVKLTGKAKREANLTSWKKGDPSPNPDGRPNGQRNFATIYKAALKKIAELQNMTPEEFEDIMLQSGLKNALKDFRFYKDMNDRLHGQPKGTTDINLSGTLSLAQLYDESKGSGTLPGLPTVASPLAGEDLSSDSPAQQ